MFFAMRERRVLIIIPAYNEVAVIGKVLSGLPKMVGEFAIDMLVIVDGSTDNTPNVASKAGATVISHLLNTGSGGATYSGIVYAREEGYKYAVTMDADGQHTAEDAVSIVTRILKNDADLVIGSRLINAKGMPWYRQMGNWGLSWITFMLFGLHVTDSQSGLKGFSRRALEELHIKSTGYEFCSEIIWRAKQLNLRVVEIPIKAIYTEYSLSKGQTNWNAVNVIKKLIKRKILELIDA